MDTRARDGRRATGWAREPPVKGSSFVPRHSRTISLYILRNLFLYAFICFLVLEAVQGIVFTVRAAEDFALEFLILFPVLLRAFGQALSFTIPVSLLMGAGFLAGRLNADRETTALRSFGLSPFQLLLPVAVAGSLLSAGAFYMNQVWMPALRYANRNVETLILDNLGYLGEGGPIALPPYGGQTLWIHRYKGPVLEGIFYAIDKDPRGKYETFIPAAELEKLNPVSYPLYLYAEKGMVYRGTEAEERRLVVDLREVRVFFDQNLLERQETPTDFVAHVQFERLRIILRFEHMALKGFKDMARSELMGAIEGHLASWRVALRAGDAEAAESSRAQYVDAVSEIHRRLSLSLTVLTFPLSAIVIGLFMRSANRLLPFFVAGTVVPGIFFGLTILGHAFARKGYEPWALEELGNFGLMLLSAILLARILRAPRG